MYLYTYLRFRTRVYVRTMDSSVHSKNNNNNKKISHGYRRHKKKKKKQKGRGKWFIRFLRTCRHLGWYKYVYPAVEGLLRMPMGAFHTLTHYDNGRILALHRACTWGKGLECIHVYTRRSETIQIFVHTHVCMLKCLVQIIPHIYPNVTKRR